MVENIVYPNELQSSQLTLRFIEYASHRILHEPTYFFQLVDPVSGSHAGKINVRASHSELIERYAGHIGYEVDELFRGRRFAAQAVEMLKPFALQLGLNPLWLTCSPENAASRRTCELIGGKLIESVHIKPDNPMYGGGAREKCRYRIDLGLVNDRRREA